jgi:hypothetical protein
MLRFVGVLVLTWASLTGLSLACECIGTQRACENLRSDAVFVGRVIETVSVKHPFEKNSWTPGYSLRFAVDEPLRGDLGTEVTIETGSGGGDCGTPLPPGGRFLIFAYRGKGGELWTGMCSGNRHLTGDPAEAGLLEEYRSLVKRRAGSVFGRVEHVTPKWEEDDVADGSHEPIEGLIVHANSDKFNAVTKTAKDGSYEFGSLPDGKYNIVPEIGPSLDFDHEYEDRYQPEVSNGQCANVSFAIQPATRIRGHVAPPAGVQFKTIQVVAIPTRLRNLNQFSGKSDFIDDQGRFDLWPLPPGDYFVGVNINSSPSQESPFPPTYYPGVANPKAASIVHLQEGEIKELELPLPEVAKPRLVHFVAIGLDGKPLRKIYIQLEDLRHPGEAASYVNVDLDENGAGTMTIYSGYSYHLHGSHWVSYGNDWCSKAVAVPEGIAPVEAKFVMYRKDANCEIADTDGSGSR